MKKEIVDPDKGDKMSGATISIFQANIAGANINLYTD